MLTSKTVRSSRTKHNFSEGTQYVISQCVSNKNCLSLAVHTHKRVHPRTSSDAESRGQRFPSRTRLPALQANALTLISPVPRTNTSSSMTLRYALGHAPEAFSIVPYMKTFIVMQASF